jgi:hypothetical protein
MSIRQLILHNFWLKALSFVIALLIWVVVQTQITGGNLALVFQPRSFGTRSFELQLYLMKTANDGRMIHISPGSVSVSVQGEKSAINNLEAKDLVAYVHLAGIELLKPNDQIVVRVDLPDGINLKEIKPPKVRADIVEPPVN